MKLTEIKSAPGFEDLLSFKDNEQEDKHNAAMIMFKFLSIVQNITKEKITRKELAKLIGTSPSYITQLFRGDKFINMLTIAKFERILDIEFDIKVKSSIAEKKTQITIDGGHFLKTNTEQLKEGSSTVDGGHTVTITDYNAHEFIPFTADDSIISLLKA